MAFIYKITNTVTGQLYVGQTSRTINERFGDHVKNSKTGTTYLYSAMRKYGKDSFNVELVEECPDSVLDEREIFWISELKSKAPTGYNMSDGGSGGDVSMSPKFIESMKKYHSTRSKKDYATFGNAGKTHSDSTKNKQSLARQKHWDLLSDDDREVRGNKISGNKNGMFGKIPKNALRIEYEGVEYKSIAEASRILRMSPIRLKREGKIIK